MRTFVHFTERRNLSQVRAEMSNRSPRLITFSSSAGRCKRTGLGDQMSKQPTMSADEPETSDALPDSAQRVLAAAIECFADLGFHGTSTRTLASKANLSLGGIYVHFKSKLDLLEFIIWRTHEEIAVDLRRANAVENPSERLFGLVTQHVHFHALQKKTARVANIELRSLPLERKRHILKIREEIDAMFATAVKDGIASGEFSVEEVRPVVFGIISMGFGVSRWYDIEGGLSPDELAEAYARAALSMVRAQSSSAAQT
jgi:AcrR family transcriptional regulator